MMGEVDYYTGEAPNLQELAQEFIDYCQNAGDRQLVTDLLHENRRLLAELEATVHRAQMAEANLAKYQTVTVARHCKNEMACEGDGSGPGWCDHDAAWEIQRMEDDGSHYSYVCNDHLDDYQKWADGEGYAPLVFETD